MLVSQIMSLAISTELKQLAVKKDSVAVISFINLGVLELHKRFTLLESEAIITLQTGKTSYSLDGSDSSVSITNPENLLIITDCYDEQGEPVIINDERNPLGIMTPSYNTVEVPNVVQDEKLSIIYRAYSGFVNSETDNIPLPPQLLEPLLHYIGYRGNSTVTVGIKEENNSHYIRFDQSCKRIIEQGLHIADDLESYTFDQRGFV